MRLFIYEAICAGALGREVAPSLRHEGAAMLSAVVADFQRGPGVDVVTLLEDDARFGDVAAGCDAALVIAPEFDHLLQRRSQEVLDLGVRLLGSSPEAIRLTADKLATARWWQERGVPHPLTVAHDPASAIPFPMPWVLKPRHGAGSQDTFLIRAPGDLPRALTQSGDDFIVQQYVEGLAASVALLISPTQVVSLLPARQHLSGDGRFRYEGGSLPLPEPLASRAVTLARRAVAGIAGLQGYVGVDLVLGDGGDFAIEINPRLTTSYIGLRQKCRQNLAEQMLRIVRGDSIGPLTWLDGEVQFHVDVTP